MFTQERAIDSFITQAKSWQRSSMLVVCSAATCLIVGTWGPDKQDFPAIIDTLKKALGEEVGMGQAMIYKYIGLARQLVQSLTGENPLVPEKTLAEVLAQRSPGGAVNVLIEFLEKNKVKSLDQLGGFLGGRYQRTVDVEDHSRRAPRMAGEGATPEGIDLSEDEDDQGEGRQGPMTTAEVVQLPSVVRAVKSDPVTLFHDIVNEIEDIDVIRAMIQLAEARVALLEARAKHSRRPRGRSAGSTTVERGRRAA